MKIQNYFLIVWVLLIGNLSNAQCDNCDNSSNIITESFNGDYMASSAQAYFWEICEGNATIIGSNTEQSVSVSCSRGTFKLKVTRFIKGNCIESCIVDRCGGPGCDDYWAAILDEYIDGTQSGSNHVFLIANGNYPAGTTYTWTTTRQNGLTQTYSPTTDNPRLVDASINNRIVSATVTVSYRNCTETVSKIFDCAIPNSDANGNLFPECHGTGGGFGRINDTIKISPNPVNNGNTIKIEGLEEYTVNSIQLIDIFGNIKLSQIKDTNKLSLNELKTGIYWVKISTKQGIIQKKIIVN